jgi:hypothetical protein
MNKIQGDPQVPDLDDDIVALLLEVFCSKKTEEIQGEEDEE